MVVDVTHWRNRFAGRFGYRCQLPDETVRYVVSMWGDNNTEILLDLYRRNYAVSEDQAHA